MKVINAHYRYQNVDILIQSHLLSELRQHLDCDRHYFIITDSHVAPLYLKQVQEQLPKADHYVMKAGESFKTMYTAKAIIRAMLKINMDRKTTIIALGGGVVGDISGFVAGIYKRGIPYVQIPTTFLAQIDSSLGGKTGIDYMKYKNQIGLINHPEKVIIDPEVLKTLPEKEMANGYAEAIKYAVTLDKDLYESLLRTTISNEDLIFRAAALKVGITEKDEAENDERLILNFGHTIGHAIESMTHFRISHGQAVALGMVYENTEENIRQDIIKLLNVYHLNTSWKHYDINKIINYIQADKKRAGDMLRAPVVTAIGSTVILSKSINEWKELWK